MAAQQCKARARNGNQCKNPAIPGGAVCRVHGGSAPAVKAAAARRQAEALAQTHAERALRRLGEPEAIDPAEALLRLVYSKHAEVAYYRAKVEGLTDDQELIWGRTKTTKGMGPMGLVDQTEEQANVHLFLQLMHKSEDQLARFTAEAMKAGIEERRLKLAEEDAKTIAWLLQGFIADLNLEPERQAQAGELLKKWLQKASDRVEIIGEVA